MSEQEEQRPHILVIDDEPHVVAYLEMLLQDAGYKTMVAGKWQLYAAERNHAVTKVISDRAAAFLEDARAEFRGHAAEVIYGTIRLIERDDLDLHATLIPAKSVAGDFFDFFFIAEHRLVFLVGDVSGKGVPAALFMAVARTLLRNLATVTRDPGEIFSRCGDMLAEDNPGPHLVEVPARQEGHPGLLAGGVDVEGVLREEVPVDVRGEPLLRLGHGLQEVFGRGGSKRGQGVLADGSRELRSRLFAVSERQGGEGAGVAHAEERPALADGLVDEASRQRRCHLGADRERPRGFSEDRHIIRISANIIAPMITGHSF